jgi:hypothetical protein
MRARFVIVLTLASLAPAAAQAEQMLLPGRYDVGIDLQRPHSEDAGAKERATVCVTAGENRGLTVLSGDNPMATCPIKNVKEEGSRLTFDIVCPAPHITRYSAFSTRIGNATYTLGPEAFYGRIVMKIGGKTEMVEVQEGLRNGDCTDAP